MEAAGPILRRKINEKRQGTPQLEFNFNGSETFDDSKFNPFLGNCYSELSRSTKGRGAQFEGGAQRLGIRLVHVFSRKRVR